MRAPDRYVALVFDVDGTLISTGGAGARAWAAAFDELYGVAADVTEFSEPGMTDPDIAKLTFLGAVGRAPERQDLARVMGRYLHHLAETLADTDGYRVMSGVQELLPALVEAGYLLGLTTGNLEAAAHIKLHPARLNRFFCFGGYGSDSGDRVQLTRRAIERAGLISGAEVEPAATIVIGDTPHDVDAAHGAGARSVGVASGSSSVEDLERAGADQVLASLSEEIAL
jgi:beta-phosphoglucomutase-like phosphatase (HAD superfamily)